LSIALEGDLDLHPFLGLKAGHAGFHDIRAAVRLVSDAADAEIEELHDRVTTTSPVGHTLQAAVPVNVHLATK